MVRRTTASVLLLTCSGMAIAAQSLNAEGLDPKEAGSRYGQALGAVEVCYGSTLTEKAKSLANTYSGSDLETFKAQAAKVYAAWTAIKGCRRQDDPNQCKIIMVKSCFAAEDEIGANGSAMAGLVEFLKH